MDLNSIKGSKLNSVDAAFLRKENAQIVAYAKKVIQGLILIYKDATNTGDTVLNLVLGRAPFIRDLALGIVMNHDVYSDLRKRGYEVHFWYDKPERLLSGLTMYMDQPIEDDTEKVAEAIERQKYESNL